MAELISGFQFQYEVNQYDDSVLPEGVGFTSTEGFFVLYRVTTKFKNYPSEEISKETTTLMHPLCDLDIDSLYDGSPHAFTRSFLTEKHVPLDLQAEIHNQVKTMAISWFGDPSNNAKKILLLHVKILTFASRYLPDDEEDHGQSDDGMVHVVGYADMENDDDMDQEYDVEDDEDIEIITDQEDVEDDVEDDEDIEIITDQEDVEDDEDIEIIIDVEDDVEDDEDIEIITDQEDVEDDEEMDRVITLSMENDNQRACFPADRSTVESLKKATYESTIFEMQTCTVCLDDFIEGEEVTLMPCDHVYHRHCIHKWLQDKNVCPLCRFTMPVGY